MNSHYPAFEHPAAWRSTQINGKDQVAIDLERPHLQALADALHHAEKHSVTPNTLNRQNFPLDDIAADVAGWRRELDEGLGFVLFRGFPVEQFSVQQWELIFLGLGIHFGRPISQSNLGDLVGHVVNIGDKDRRERAYRNSRKLDLHTDRCDYIGMLCLTQAKEGGLSGYASALTIHNIIREERPELLEPLYEGYRLHRFGEQTPGEPPVTEVAIPIFSVCEGYPNVIFIRGYIDLAVDEGFYALSDTQSEALDFMETVSNREDVCLKMMLEPGEATITNNCLLLHDRTAFTDGDTDDTRRHLLRLWLTDPDRPASHGVLAHKTDQGIAKQDGRGTYYKGAGFTGTDADDGY